MSEQDDASLVGAVLAGESECFCALVRRYQDHVYGVALAVLADFDLALDAAQEAFVCAYCELDKLRDPARFGGWLCGIARNTAFEIRRDRQRQQTLAQGAAERAVASETEPSAQELTEAAEQRVVVQQALLRVNEKDREALTLYYADGFNHSEICGFLGISSGTLKGRLQRGRAALRKELAMIEQACKDNAPDEAFVRRLERTLRVFGTKGPPTHHLPSPWAQSLREETRSLLKDGEEGFRVDVALSHSGSARQRWHAVTHMGLRKDDRSLRELERMLEDRAPRVRMQAVRWYANRIHPDVAVKNRPLAAASATAVVPGIGNLLERMRDESFNVRFAAVVAVGAYRGTGDERVARALRQALDDPKHKVRHAAARILEVSCPGCGRRW